MRSPIITGLLLWALPAFADVSGVAVVIDGDTLRIGQDRIRLSGIDAPEGKQSCQREGVPWLCGQEAGVYLRKLLSDEPVACAEQSKDRYGRVVAICRLTDGRDVGEVMVKAGFALAYRRYGGKVYDFAENDAKEAKRGLWAGSFVPPWEWRRLKRNVR
jgi:endonuclease YncB( thermonuclease family)